MGNGNGVPVTGRRQGLGKKGDDRVTGPDQCVLARVTCQSLDEICRRFRVSARPRPPLVVCRVVRETGGGSVMCRDWRAGLAPEITRSDGWPAGTNTTGTGLADEPEHGDAPAVHDVG